MASDKPTSKILFVDDDELVLSGITLTVGRQYDISTAISGMEGLELVEKEGPFAVIGWGEFQ
jgi:CheY-like chemotaxis protein